MTTTATLEPKESAGTERSSPSEAPLRSPGQSPVPTHSAATWLFIKTDLGSIARSWMCRGFLLATVLITLLELKGMQAEQKSASQMLEAVYVTYLLVWMHGVIFIAGSALMR